MLSDNDWKRLSRALRDLEELTLTRTLGRKEVTVRVTQATKVWPVPMIVGIQYKSPSLDWSQYFERIEDARRAWEEQKI